MRKVILGLLVVFCMLYGTCAFAGGYHGGVKLSCSQCHIMHSTNNGTLYNGGTGFPGLLKGSINQTCLSCHDSTSRDCVSSGTATTPNDTLSVIYPSVYKNSGGYFQSDWATTASPFGHDIGPNQVTAIQGSWTSRSFGMACTDCHDPHGNTNYRNMVSQPGTAITQIEVEEEKQVFVDSSLTGWANAKDTNAVAFNDNNNIVEWCVGCHTNITTGNKHPQNVAISGVEDNGDNWENGTKGFGVDTGDTLRGTPRVRFGQAGIDFNASKMVSGTNKVLCLSCHKAHGSKFEAALLWPHTTKDAADRSAGCNQCHAQGE